MRAGAVADWGRFFGEQIDNRYQAFADPRASGWMGGFQGGLDLWRGSFLPGHRDAAGVYFAYGHSDLGVNGLVTNSAAPGYVLTHTGTVNLNAYSTGAYWTHYGPSGWYIDAVLQGTYYNGDATTQFAQLPANGLGFTSSLEAGYPVPLPLGPRFVLEPQAQIIWQQVTRSTRVMTGLVRSRSARPQARAAGSACAASGQSSAKTVRSGNLMCARISGATGAPRRRQRLGSTRYRCWSRQRG